MELAEITKLGGKNKRRRRVGRGRGSGSGKTCGRGHKGAGSRAGNARRGAAEGGQMPLFRRIPKRGFNNARFATRYNVINISELERLFDAGAHVTPAALVDAGMIRDKRLGVKILGNGELTKKMTVEASKFSKQASEKITGAGGEAKIIGAAGS